jgi:hypothetical protein
MSSSFLTEPAVIAYKISDRSFRARREAIDDCLGSKWNAGSLGELLSTLGVIVSTSAARRRTCGSQSGRRSAPLGPARHNGPQRSAAAEVHQSRAERRGRSSSAASARSSRPNCASGHSVPLGSNRRHRRSGLGYRFRAERRAVAGVTTGVIRDGRGESRLARTADEPGEHRFQHRPAAV